jgi:hypothetical protein
MASHIVTTLHTQCCKGVEDETRFEEGCSQASKTTRRPLPLPSRGQQSFDLLNQAPSTITRLRDNPASSVGSSCFASRQGGFSGRHKDLLGLWTSRPYFGFHNVNHQDQSLRSHTDLKPTSWPTTLLSCGTSIAWALWRRTAQMLAHKYIRSSNQERPLILHCFAQPLLVHVRSEFESRSCGYSDRFPTPVFCDRLQVPSHLTVMKQRWR